MMKIYYRKFLFIIERLCARFFFSQKIKFFMQLMFGSLILPKQNEKLIPFVIMNFKNFKQQNKNLNNSTALVKSRSIAIA